MPSFEPIDQSRAVTHERSDVKHYENPKYGVHFVVPATWNLDLSDKGTLVKATRLEGACEVELMGQSSLPLRSLGYEVEALSREILDKNENFRRVGERPVALGNIKEGHEIQFVAAVEEQEVLQRYLVARKNMAVYILVTTMASTFQPGCEKDAEGIRENVRIEK